MTRLQTYILSEGRGQGIYFSDAQDILHNKCKQALKAFNNGTTIWRGIDEVVPYYLIKPLSNDFRESRNTENYYTLIINNHPSWSKFPKRQIICSTDSYTAKTYGRGNAYVVFPFDGAKIGVCPDEDIWSSFGNLEAPYFNECLKNLIGKDYRTYNGLKSYLSDWKISDIDWDSIRADNWGYAEELYDVFIRSGKKYETVWDALVGTYSPKNFKVVTVGSSLPKNKEVWTDAHCLMVHNRLGKELIG